MENNPPEHLNPPEAQTLKSRGNDEFFRIIADYTADWEIWIGPRKEIRYMSPACFRITGYTADEFLSAPDLIEKILHEDDRQKFADHTGDIARPDFCTLEFRMVRRDGAIRWIEHVCTPVYGKDGDFLGRRISNRDVTERKQMEQTIAETEQRYRAIFEKAANPILVVNEQGRYVDANEAALEFLETTREKLLGKTVRDYSPEELQEQLKRGHSPFLEPRTLETEYQVGLKRKTLLLNVVPLETKNGRILFGIGQDITEIKDARKEREIVLSLLSHLNQPNQSHELMRNIALLMKDWSGCEAVGIRLRDGEDFPYHETRGFPADFVRREKHLCALDAKGEILRDSTGNPVLECMCGNVIMGRFDPGLPFFTTNGSFWTNSTTQLLASTTEEDRQARTRNRCNGEGYESVALIPLHFGGQRLGLLQFNDRRQGRFSETKIGLLERLAANLSIGIIQRQAADALRKNEEKFRVMAEMLDNAPGSVTIHDADGRFLYANQKTFEIHGSNPGEFMAMNLHDVDVPESEALIQERIKLIQKQGGATFEVSHYRKDGRIFPLEVITKTVSWEGKPAIMSIATDITERKKAEQQLKQNQEELSKNHQILTAILDHTPILAVLLDAEFNFIWVNRAYAASCGYDQSFFHGKNHFELYPHEENKAIFQGVVDSGEPFFVYAKPFEFPDQPDRGLTYWDWSLIPIKNDSGRITEIVFTLQEVTERIAQEAELRLKSLVLDQIQDHVTITDLNGVIRYVNQAEVDLMKRPRYEIIGQPITIYGEDAEKGATQQEILEKTLHEGEWRGEVVNFGADGEKFIMDCRTQVIRDMTHRPIALCGIATDITKRKRMEETLKSNERNYGTLFNAISESVCLLDKESNIVLANNTFAERLGTGVDDCIGKPLVDFLTSDIVENRKVFTDRVAATGQVVTFEAERQGRWMHHSIWPVLGEDGSVEGLAIYATDFTERKQIFDALKESEANLAAVIHANQDAAFLIDPEAVVILCNPISASRVGARPEDLVGRCIYDFLPPEIVENRKKFVRQAFETGESVQFEDIRNGRFISHHVHPIRDAGGRVCRAAVFGQDVTEYRNAEESLRKQKDLLAAVRQAQELFISGHDPRDVYREVLSILIRATHSQYGFLDEVLFDPDGTPYKLNLALSNISWDDASRQLYEQLVQRKLEFRNLNNLAGLPVLENRMIIANHVSEHPGYTGLPKGHPLLTTYLGIPLHFGSDIIGVAAVANCPEGYTDEIAEFIRPLTQACAAMIWAGKALEREKQHLVDLESREKAMRILAESNSQTGEDILHILVRELAALQGVRYAFIAGIDPEDPGTAHTIAVWSNNGFDRNSNYVLANTPCWYVVDQGVCFYPSGVRELFPEDHLLKEMGAESYWGAPLHDDSGNVFGILAILDDRPMTDSPHRLDTLKSFAVRASSELKRSLAEDALHERERTWATLIENLPGFVYRCANNRDWTMTYISQGCEDVTGYALEDFLQNNVLVYNDIVHPDYRESLWRKWQELLPVRGVFQEEYPVIAKSGEIRWVWERGQGIFDDRGELLFLEGFITDITEKKLAETRLKDALTELTAIHQHAPIAMIIVDRDRRVRKVNQAVLNISGKTEDEIAGMRGGEILRCLNSLDDPQGCGYGPGCRDCLIRKAVADTFADRRGIENLESWIPVKTGHGVQQQWLQIATAHLKMKSEELVLVCAQDITKRKNIEGALKQSEEYFRAVYEHNPTGIAIVDPENQRFIRANQSFLDIVGYSETELTRMSVQDITHPEDWAFEKDLVAKRLNSEIPEFDLVKRYVRKDGAIRWVRLMGDWIQVSSVKSLALATAQDITRHRQMEEALKNSEERYRELVENANSIIIRMDPEGNVIFFNEFAQKFFGYTAREVIGKNVVGTIVPETDVAGLDLRAMIRDILARPDRYAANENENMRRDGVRVWISWTNKPLFDETGRIREILCVGNDATVRRQSELEREKLQSQLNQAQKMESVGRLAGGVAHDFNNMLGVILGHAEMALEQTKPADPLFTDLQEIWKAAQRSADLTRQLLAFARKQTVAPRVLDLNEIVKSMLKMLTRLIGEDIDLAWQPGDGLWSVRVDPSQIDQILANLCVNARDAIPGMGKVTIRTGNVVFNADDCAAHPGFVPGAYVLLRVSDDGCGMDRETLDKLFEPFFTTKETGKGTGLGLAMVYGIVRQNNGFISVDSSPGQGTTFSIYLPRYLNKTLRVRQTDPDLQVSSGSETILLVEDEPAILKMTTMMLKRLGYAVLPATRPGEAIRLAEDHPGRIHLLMTDVIMPEMNGRDLAKNLLLLYPKLKRLFMSGYTADVIAHQGVLDKGVHFIHKPFSVKDLAAKVRKAMEENNE